MKIASWPIKVDDWAGLDKCSNLKLSSMVEINKHALVGSVNSSIADVPLRSTLTHVRALLKRRYGSVAGSQDIRSSVNDHKTNRKHILR